MRNLNVKSITIKSVAQLCCVVDSQFQDNIETTVIYRGLADIGYRLCPKAGRFNPPENSGQAELNESLMLQLFRRQSVGLTSQILDGEWEFLAVAQHHGMLTRLMDWTRSPLVAAYFAVASANQTYQKKEHSDSYVLREPDSVIYAWRCPKIHLSAKPSNDPLKIEKVVRYVPRYVTPRIKAQSGLFSAHPKPKEELCDPDSMVKLVIPFRERPALKHSL